jgi:hypothetical protein
MAGGKHTKGAMAITVAGSTVTLQFSMDSGINWYDYDDYTAVGLYVVEMPVSGIFFRAGVKQASWSSAATVTLSQGTK